MTTPALSVILLAPVDFRHIQKTVRHLRAQTRASEIELVIGIPTQNTLVCDPCEWEGLHSVQIIPVGEITMASPAKMQTLKHASAAIIAFAEDHVFPSPNWADALIQTHQGPYAAVGVEMRNANPSALSRADMHLSFGNYIAPAVRGLVDALPGHNTSYKRQVLDVYGTRAAAMLDAETVMHAEMRQHNQQLFLEAHAFISHLNIARWLPFVKHKFYGGRVFGASRREKFDWSAMQRALYILGAPLIPFVRLKRMLPNLRRTRALETFDPQFILALAFGLAIHATGEAVGYAFGPGNVAKQYATLELHRADQLRDNERHLAFQ